MQSAIERAIENSLHYLEGEESYSYSSTAKYVHSSNKSFLTAIQLQIGGKIEETEFGHYLNF